MRLYSPLLILATIGCGRPHVPARDEINVATAANLTRAFTELGQMFERETGVHVVYSFGATTQLTQQIENGAPYDVFAAADVEHVEELARQGLIVPATRAIFARGKLMLWVPEMKTSVERIEDLQRDAVKHVAVANPKLAPYGRAAVESLRILHLWDAIQPKVVFAQNVSIATEYAATGNADAAFTALALVYDRAGRKIEIPESLYQPIDQAIAVLQRTSKPEPARKFTEFITGTRAKKVLQRYGYE